MVASIDPKAVLALMQNMIITKCTSALSPDNGVSLLTLKLRRLVYTASAKKGTSHHTRDGNNAYDTKYILLKGAQAKQLDVGGTSFDLRWVSMLATRHFEQWVGTLPVLMPQRQGNSQSCPCFHGRLSKPLSVIPRRRRLSLQQASPRLGLETKKQVYLHNDYNTSGRTVLVRSPEWFYRHYKPCRDE